MGLDLPDLPPFEIQTNDKGEEAPVLTGVPRLVLAWEATAGRVKKRSKPKPKTDASDEIVLADPNRPARPYRLTDSYEPGDSIKHPTLGDGVVQAPGGPGKIYVLFGEDRKTLVHERPS